MMSNAKREAEPGGQGKLGAILKSSVLGDLGAAAGAIDYVTVSNGIKRLERKLVTNGQLRSFVEKVRRPIEK